jgi:L-asparaginase
MKHIAVLTTGGTIAMAEDQVTKGVNLRDPHSLFSLQSLLQSYAEITMESLFQLPSPHITPKEMYSIAKRVKELLDEPTIDGVVITHGTDTLEETAYFLDLVISSDKPVVLTGAMRSQNELGADGPYNLVQAIRVAASDKAWGYGTLVVFQNEIHTARDVTKIDTSSLDAFQSPMVGPIGYLTREEVCFDRHISRENFLPLRMPTNSVALIKVVTGADHRMLDWIIQQDYQGVVIEGFGQGNLPPQMLSGIEKALLHSIPVVLVSRCLKGVVQDTYAYDGGGKQLKEMGVLFSKLSGPKARIKLLLALPDLDLPSVFT